MTVADPSQPGTTPGYHPAVPAQTGRAATPYPVPVPQGFSQYQQPVMVMAPKSAGLAVFFTFLWLGVGHLYAGKTGAGIALVLLDLFVLTPLVFVFFIGVLLWFIIAPIVMIFAAKAANDFNHRNGIVVR